MGEIGGSCSVFSLMMSCLRALYPDRSPGDLEADINMLFTLASCLNAVVDSREATRNYRKFVAATRDVPEGDGPRWRGSSCPQSLTSCPTRASRPTCAAIIRAKPRGSMPSDRAPSPLCRKGAHLYFFKSGGWNVSITSMSFNVCRRKEGFAGPCTYDRKSSLPRIPAKKIAPKNQTRTNSHGSHFSHRFYCRRRYPSGCRWCCRFRGLWRHLWRV